MEEKEARTRAHIEDVSSNHSHSDDSQLHVIDQTVNAAALPKGYFRSRFFLGSSAAVALSLLATVSAFGYAAPILAVINEDIGPDPNYVWVSKVLSPYHARSPLLILSARCRFLWSTLSL
jgi:hypothetical protein